MIRIPSAVCLNFNAKAPANSADLHNFVEVRMHDGFAK